ncbi:MAG: alpha/beta hydrolase [Saprospiraceae bacterium]|nr:alpha/beta hydrolase [Saprospiraceae bacterium]
MTSVYYETAAGRTHALRFGRGDTLLIAFHGFSQQASSFLSLPDELLSAYTVLAVDLPFHGQTEWLAAEFSPRELIEIITEILRCEKREQYALLGFSFGARLALVLLPLLQPKPVKLFLFSPEGVKTLGMNSAERTPVWLRRVLFWRIKNPRWLLVVSRFAEKSGLIPAFYRHFLQKNLSDPTSTKRSFGCWLSLRHFRLNATLIQHTLRTFPVNTEVWAGLKDPLTDPLALQNCFEKLPGVSIKWLEKGHRLW